MRQMARSVLLLVLLAGAAMAARADVTPVDLGSSSNDFKIILNDPTCTPGPSCFAFDYNGTSPTTSIAFSVAPPGYVPIPSGQMANCSTDLLNWTCYVVNSTGNFNSVTFYDKFPPNDAISSGSGTFTVQLSGLPSIDLIVPSYLTCDPATPCPGGIADIAATPELPTFALFGTGLLLVFGGMFWRRRLSMHSVSRERAPVPVPQA